MKKLIISICVIFVILSMAAGYVTIKLINRPQIRLFEGVDTDSITEIHISYIGGIFVTKDRSQILDIMHYLKSLKLYKRSNDKVPNTTPDSGISVICENGSVNNVEFYGDVANIRGEEHNYTAPSSIHRDLEELCEKYK